MQKKSITAFASLSIFEYVPDLQFSLQSFLHVKTEKEIWATKMVRVLALTILFCSLMGKGLVVLEKKDLGLGKWRGEKAESEQWFGQVAAAWTPAPPMFLLLISKALRRSNYQCFQFPVTQHLWAGTGRKSVCVSVCPSPAPNHILLG